MIILRFKDIADAIRSINQRYRTPHLQMTRMARVCLGLLRGYLLLLVAILVFKFIQAVR